MSETPAHTRGVCGGCSQPITDSRPVEHEGVAYCARCVAKALENEAARLGGPKRGPGWAVVLSLIPGLGQMYSGQMTRGLLILGGFMFAASGPSLGQLQTPVVFTLYCWNLFDAYWITQRINRAGIPIPPPLPEEHPWESAASPAWGVMLILVGAVFLLNNLGVRWLTFDRAWPAVLLGLGIWLLIVFALSRRSGATQEPGPQETDHGETAQNLSR